MSTSVTGISTVTPVPETFGGGFNGFTRTPDPKADLPAYRLTIEEGPGGFIYKMKDQVTGEVIRQLPREDVLKLQSRPDAGQGSVFDTRA